MSQIQTTSEGKTAFKVHENSNYKVIMTYDKVEIITSAQFKKLALVLFKGETTFVTINDSIVQVKDIRIIEPTEELTESRKDEIRKSKEEQEAKANEKYRIAGLINKYGTDYFNSKYGKDKWATFAVSENETKVSIEDWEEVERQFFIKNPELKKVYES